MEVRNILIFTGLIVWGYWVSLGRCTSDSNESNHPRQLDTLKIGYSDTNVTDKIIVGELIYPKRVDKENPCALSKNKILLVFKSGNYYYVFYNRKYIDEFLDYRVWEYMLPKYLHVYDSANNVTRQYKVIEYQDGPFLTGFYNEKDSIIVSTHNLRNRLNYLSFSYFSTYDTIYSFEKSIRVGDSIGVALRKINLSEYIKNGRCFDTLKIVLLIADSRIENAWYKKCSGIFDVLSEALILTFLKNRLYRIEFVSPEFVRDVYMKRQIFTKDVHMH